MDQPLVSIVSGTLNRLPHLQRMIASVREDLGTWPVKFPYQIIVVDGGSTDATLEWLQEYAYWNKADQRFQLVVLEQGHAFGAAAAFQEGFLRASGDYIVNLNDDAIVHGPVIGVAVQQMLQRDLYGQIAIPFTSPPRAAPPQVLSIHVGEQDYLYANFGVTRRDAGNIAGWWRPDLYFQYGGDTHLSMAVWELGYVVVPLEGNGYIEHLEVNDATRQWNPQDTPNFFKYWNERAIPRLIDEPVEGIGR